MIYFILSIVMFAFGFAYNNLLNNQELTDKARVTGIGGIFFKSDKPKELKEWYQGIDSTKRSSTQWSIFNSKSKYMEPSTKDFIINYRVNKLDELLINLKNNNVIILDTIESFDYGRFVHIMDIDGNKIELWEASR